MISLSPQYINKFLEYLHCCNNWDVKSRTALLVIEEPLPIGDRPDEYTGGKGVRLSLSDNGVVIMHLETVKYSRPTWHIYTYEKEFMRKLISVRSDEKPTEIPKDVVSNPSMNCWKCYDVKNSEEWVPAFFNGEMMIWRDDSFKIQGLLRNLWFKIQTGAGSFKAIAAMQWLGIPVIQ